MNLLDREFNISIKESELLELLRTKLLVNQPDKFAALIMGHLNSPFATTQLYKALQGLYPVMNYNVGDPIYVKLERLADWRYDKGKTLALPGVLNETYIPCQIESVNPYRENSYNVVYRCVKAGQSESGEDSYEIQEKSIHSIIENFETVLEELEKDKQNNT